MKFSKYVTMQKLKEDAHLIINSMSGAIDIVDQKSKDVIDLIKSGEYVEQESDEELLESLKSRGYLFEDAEQEMKYIESVFNIYNKFIDKKAAKIVICPTFSCNLRCVYCFESLDIRKSSKVMDIRDIDNIFNHIDTILKEKNLESYEVELFGGEPLLPITYEANKHIFELCRERGKFISIISNGTHINYYEELLNEYRDCVDNIQITIDGVKAIHDRRRIKVDKTGTFDTIVNGIDKLLELKIKVGVRINVDRENIDSLKELVGYFEEKGWNKTKYFHADVAPVVDHTCAQLSDSIMKENEIIRKIQKDFPRHKNGGYFNLQLFRVLNHLNNVIENNSEMLAIPSFHYCEGNRMEFYVFAPDGYIYLCPEAVGSKQAIIGEYDENINLYDSNIDWKNRNILTVPKCRDCEIAPFCGGGCPFASISVNNDINEPLCDDSKEVLKDYIESIKHQILEFGNL